MPTQRISKKALAVWKLKGILVTGMFFLITISLYSVYLWMNFSIYLAGSAGVLTVLTGVWTIWVLPQLRWRIWRYEVHEKEMELLRGVFIKRHTLIPMTRIQHVDTEQGPIYKRYGLTAVTISTAAGIHEIPALSEEVGGRLRDQIAYLAGMEENHE
ncbi:hypothetical protein SAMN05192534_101473 [Alteribacillus persepolensis]|uniref:YdbS-like PH domain-containing protein n=1 Tax=Alteribacillus persepolensis TaxID=568899 RepID=A0A1G7ZB04_9BACI|nr:PH domain-containing protein [Alteribacillus persepolensis]SDH05789.1 hypothetical protein SAMN05192534_101473 [Alteribacillus persepolensis]